MNKKTFYITTPIYYSSGNFHIGHCYTTVSCDAIARFKRMDGYDVFYLTGTDEHGQKVQQRAQAAGVTPKEFVDKLYNQIVDLWKILDISYDEFIRTTDDYHEATVQKIYQKYTKSCWTAATYTKAVTKVGTARLAKVFGRKANLWTANAPTADAK